MYIFFIGSLFFMCRIFGENEVNPMFLFACRILWFFITQLQAEYLSV